MNNPNNQSIFDPSKCPHCKAFAFYIYDTGVWYCASCKAITIKRQVDTVICPQCFKIWSHIVQRIFDHSRCPHCKIFTSYIYDKDQWFCMSCGALTERKK